MKTPSLKHLLTGLAIAITPTSKIADQGPKIDLETMIPKQFGEWKMDGAIAPLLADPKQTALLNPNAPLPILFALNATLGWIFPGNKSNTGREA